jgi:hypothetical protein
LIPGKQIYGATDLDGEWGQKCRFGEPGDGLWVRETWGHDGAYFDGVQYKADFPHDDICVHYTDWKWRPSIHMKRKYSRINLEVTGVRVERLQDITEEGAKAEGVIGSWLDVGGDRVNAPGRPTYRQGYALLWNHINGPGSWYLNPWIWVVAFNRVK